MKKLVSLVLILTVLLSCVSALAQSEDYTGEWYLNSVEAEGLTMNPASLGMEMTITLNADGTAVSSSNMSETAETSEGTWTVNGDVIVLTMDDMTQEMTLTDGQLVAMTEDGSKMIFGRELETGEAYVPAELRADAALEDYNGTWTATLMDMLGIQVAPEMLGSGIIVTIENGAATVTETNFDGTESVYAMKGELDNGALKLTGEADENGNVKEMTLALLADGKLVYDQTSEEMGSVKTFFDRAAE